MRTTYCIAFILLGVLTCLSTANAWNPVDWELPVPVVDDGDYTSSTTQLYAEWTPTGKAEYIYAIGTTPCGSDIVDWVSVGTNTSVTRAGLNLVHGQTYYFAVRYKNSEGYWSNHGCSDGVIVCETAASVQEALLYTEGTTIALVDRIVSTATGEFTDGFYVQDPPGVIKGIKIVYSGPTTVSRGDIVTVVGDKLIDDTYKEAYIDTASVEVTSTQSEPNPIMIFQQKWLGGGDLGENPGVNWPPYGGTYNKGLLVKSSGTVTGVFAEDKCFYFDDGCLLDDTTPYGVTGVRVSWDINGAANPIMPPAVGWHVSVTGISSSYCISTDPLKIIRVLRPRDQEDILVNSTSPPSSEAQNALAFVPDGEYVDLRYRVVTSVPFSNCFYIESVDQSSGIAVIEDDTSVQPGDMVNVYGRIVTWSGERIIQATSVTVLDVDYPLPRILNLHNRDVTGGQFGYTPGVPDGVGLPTSGLLSRIYGSITNEYMSGFYVNDGSDIEDYGDTGVFVYYPYQPLGQYAQAVGVCGANTWDLADYPSRILYTQAQGDVDTDVSLGNETVPVSSAGFRLLGLPAPPDDPSPSSVFADLGSDFWLSRYDYAAGQSFDYPGDPEFGNMLMANAYWLLNSSAQSSFSYSARQIDDGDWWVNLPSAGISPVPNPTTGEVPWQNVRVCDGGETITLSEALEREWLEPTALSCTGGTYQSVDLSNPSSSMLRGYAYVLYPKRDMLALLIPPPGPRTTYCVTGTVYGGGEEISGARVFCDTGSAITDVDGSYSLYVTRIGDMSISASAPGYHTETQLLTVTGSDDSTYFFLDPSEVTLSVYSEGSINTCVGETSTTVWAFVRYMSGDPVEGKSVTFSTTLGLLNGSASPQVVETDINGIASVTVTVGTDPDEDAIVTASTTSPDLSESVHVFLGCPPPADVVAMATGADQITLFWEGADYASGYNVYRGLTTGGPYIKVNDSPVTTVDPGPGLVNRLMFTDDDDGNGLIEDTQYFYYVVGVLPDESEVLPSLEDSAAPDTDALPWDTADPYEIIWAAHNIMDVEPSWPLGLLTICGPNGVIYEEYNDYYWAAALPSVGYVDEERARVVYSDGTTAPILMDSEASASPPEPYPGADPGFDGYTKTNPPTGIYRKVASQPGYKGLEARLALPDTSEQYCKVGDDYPAFKETQDMGYIYAGGTGNGWDVDAGLQVGHTGNPGWKPFIRAKRGKQVLHGKPKYPEASGIYWVTTGQPVKIRFKTPGLPGTPDKHVSLRVESIGGNGIKHEDPRTGEEEMLPYCTFVCVVPGWHPSSVLKIKRVNSIAQDDLKGSDADRGYAVTGSYVLGGSWGMSDPLKVQLLTPTGAVSWDQIGGAKIKTSNAGSFPGEPQVQFLPHNRFFWEEFILGLRTDPFNSP